MNEFTPERLQMLEMATLSETRYRAEVLALADALRQAYARIEQLQRELADAQGMCLTPLEAADGRAEANDEP